MKFIAPPIGFLSILLVALIFSVRAADRPTQEPVAEIASPQKDPGPKPSTEWTEAEKKAFVKELLIKNGLLDPRGWNFPKMDLEQLLEAWRQGPAGVKGGKWIIPPAGGKERQVVGDDYPNKALFSAPSKGGAKSDQQPKQNGKAPDAKLPYQKPDSK